MRVLRAQLDPDDVDDAVEDVAKLVGATDGASSPPPSHLASNKRADALSDRADTYSDNRDFKTLPNYQRKTDSTIWQQTELAGRQDVRCPSVRFEKGVAN